MRIGLGPSSGWISVLQLGHRNRFCSQLSRQSSWKVCPHRGTTFTFSLYTKSLRQIEQLLYLKSSSFFPLADNLCATELQTISLLEGSSDHCSFRARIDFSVRLESPLETEHMLSLRVYEVSPVSSDFKASASNSSSELIFGRYCFSTSF